MESFSFKLHQAAKLNWKNKMKAAFYQIDFKINLFHYNFIYLISCMDRQPFSISLSWKIHPIKENPRLLNLLMMPQCHTHAHLEYSFILVQLLVCLCFCLLLSASELKRSVKILFSIFITSSFVAACPNATWKSSDWARLCPSDEKNFSGQFIREYRL